MVRLPWGGGGWSEGVGLVMRRSPPCRDPPAGKQQAQEVMTAEPEVERF